MSMYIVDLISFELYLPFVVNKICSFLDSNSKQK